MKARRLLIFGASGHGRVVADAARAAGWELAGWGDGDGAKQGSEIAGARVLTDSAEGAVRAALEGGWHLVMGIGDNRIRRRVFRVFAASAAPLATVIHPRAVVAPSAQVGAGTVIFAGAVVNADARVGVNAIVNTAATVDHDGILGDHCHLSPGAHLGGGVVLGEGSHLGIGAAVRDGIRIGAWSVVGAGAAVVKDLPDRVVAYGVPARVIRRNEPEP